MIIRSLWRGNEYSFRRIYIHTYSTIFSCPGPFNLRYSARLAHTLMFSVRQLLCDCLMGLASLQTLVLIVILRAYKLLVKTRLLYSWKRKLDFFRPGQLRVFSLRAIRVLFWRWSSLLGLIGYLYFLGILRGWPARRDLWAAQYGRAEMKKKVTLI